MLGSAAKTCSSAASSAGGVAAVVSDTIAAFRHSSSRHMRLSDVRMEGHVAGRARRCVRAGLEGRLGGGGRQGSNEIGLRMYPRWCYMDTGRGEKANP